MSILHKSSYQTSNIKILLNVIPLPGPKLESLLWESAVSLIRYRINKSYKPLLKFYKLTFRIL